MELAMPRETPQLQIAFEELGVIRRNRGADTRPAFVRQLSSRAGQQSAAGSNHCDRDNKLEAGTHCPLVYRIELWSFNCKLNISEGGSRLCWRVQSLRFC